MPLAKIQKTIFKVNSNTLPASGHTYSVQNSGGGLALTIYGNSNGTGTPLDNPGTLPENGLLAFFVRSGTCRIKVVDPDTLEEQIWDGEPCISPDVLSSASAPIQFATIQDFVAGNALNKFETIDFADYNGEIVFTKYNNATSKAGGAPYIIKTVAQAAADGDVIDGTGSPNYYGANHALTGGTHVAVLKKGVSVNPFQYGAIGDGTTDDTAVFNLALQSDRIYADVDQVNLDLVGGHFAIFGQVWVRKGQTISGGGAHAFMSSTGSFKLGYKSDDTQDSGGAPVTLNDIWMEGGSNPIVALIPGYTIRNVFSSSPASGSILRGSDGVISDCIFDNASTSVSFSARNSIIHGCDFYLSNTQILIGSEDSVISACTFNYSKVVAIDWASTTCYNTKIIGCTFVKNAQDAGTFLGFVRTRTVTTAPVGDLEFSDCNFRNCYGAAINNSGTSNHRMTFRGCEFNGLKTNVSYAQGTTMFALDSTSSGSRGNVDLIDCDFKNLLATPIQIDTNEAANFKFKDLDFSNCAGTTSISIAGLNTQTYEIGNIHGDNKDLLLITNSPAIKYFGYMRDWLELKDDGTYSYIEIPFVDPMIVELSMVANFNPGANASYRFAEKNTASITYDFAGGVLATVATVNETYKANTGISADFAVSAAVDTIATGASKATALGNGKLILYWTNVYASDRLNVEILI